MPRKLPSRKKMQALVKKWQKILRLQDWDVTVGKPGVNPNGGVASVDGLDQYKSATIFFGDKTFDGVNGPIEETIIHELLHLHFNSFEEKAPSKAANRALEQVINILSELLWKGRKGL